MGQAPGPYYCGNRGSGTRSIARAEASKSCMSSHERAGTAPNRECE